MASNVPMDVADQSIARLASHIAVITMKSIAVAHLGLTPEQVENIEYAKRDDTSGIITEILTNWAYRTRGTDQIGTLAGILYHAGVDPEVVQGILGVSKQDAIKPAAPTIQQIRRDLQHLDEDSEKMVEAIKEFTEDTMKVEMAPWAADYTVKMEYLYTELTLDKLDNKPTGPGGQIIPDYKDLFTGSQPDKPEIKRTKPKGKRILVKADPGFGKTTFSKKVAYDWATGVFHTVSIVFCIFLKLVRPGSDIENIIIEQYPPVEGLEIDEQRLKKMIQSFGNKCLIIFDGLDEIDLKQHGDVLKVIQGAKFPRCHVILTSRLHSVANIAHHFPTIIQSQGFDRQRTKEFLTNCLREKYQVVDVMVFHYKTFTQEGQIYSSPMLLLFISILFNADEISVLEEDIVLGDIYFRLVRCLYRKFCVKKGWEFNDDRFIDLVKRVGKVAWDMLQSGVNWYKKSEIVRLVGEEAFDTGLVIGSMDLTLMSEETADINVSYPHRTIQEFMGVYHFVLALIEGKDIRDHIKIEDHTCILFDNPLCLYFCVYLLKTLDAEKYLYDVIVPFLASQLNVCQMIEPDLMALHPEIFEARTDHSVYGSVKGGKNRSKMIKELGVDLMGDILAKCDKVKQITMDRSILVDVYSQAPALEVLILNETDNQVMESQFLTSLTKSPHDEFSLVVDSCNMDTIEKVLRHYQAKNRRVSLYAITKTSLTRELREYLKGNMARVHVLGDLFADNMLAADKEIPHCPILSDLSLMNLKHAVGHISIANSSKHFPVLSLLSFEDCGFAMKGTLRVLLLSEWPELTHLNLRGCDLDVEDIQELQRALKRPGNSNVPKLESIALDVNKHGEPIAKMFESRVTKLKHLQLYNVSEIFSRNFRANRENLPNLETLLISGDSCRKKPVELDDTLPPTFRHLSLRRFRVSKEQLKQFGQLETLTHLEKLDLSRCSGLTGKLSHLLSQPFPSLKSLVLSDCGLNSDDLTSLAEASVDGRLPKLTDLDVSENKVSDQLGSLFSRNCKWEKLERFNMKDDLQSSEGLETVAERINNGCLGSVEILKTMVCDNKNLFSCITAPMSKLETTELRLGRKNKEQSQASILKSILRASDKELLPALRSIVLESNPCDNDVIRVKRERRLLNSRMEKMKQFFPEKMVDKFAKYAEIRRENYLIIGNMGIEINQLRETEPEAFERVCNIICLIAVELNLNPFLLTASWEENIKTRVIRCYHSGDFEEFLNITLKFFMKALDVQFDDEEVTEFIHNLCMTMMGTEQESTLDKCIDQIRRWTQNLDKILIDISKRVLIPLRALRKELESCRALTSVFFLDTIIGVLTKTGTDSERPIGPAVWSRTKDKVDLVKWRLIQKGIHIYHAQDQTFNLAHIKSHKGTNSWFNSLLSQQYRSHSPLPPLTGTEHNDYLDHDLDNTTVDQIRQSIMHSLYYLLDEYKYLISSVSYGPPRPVRETVHQRLSEELPHIRKDWLHKMGDHQLMSSIKFDIILESMRGDPEKFCSVAVSLSNKALYDVTIGKLKEIVSEVFKPPFKERIAKYSLTPEGFLEFHQSFYLSVHRRLPESFPEVDPKIQEKMADSVFSVLSRGQVNIAHVASEETYLDYIMGQVNSAAGFNKEKLREFIESTLLGMRDLVAVILIKERITRLEQTRLETRLVLLTLEIPSQTDSSAEDEQIELERLKRIHQKVVQLIRSNASQGSQRRSMPAFFHAEYEKLFTTYEKQFEANLESLK